MQADVAQSAFQNVDGRQEEGQSRQNPGMQSVLSERQGCGEGAKQKDTSRDPKATMKDTRCNCLFTNVAFQSRRPLRDLLYVLQPGAPSSGCFVQCASSRHVGKLKQNVLANSVQTPLEQQKLKSLRRTLRTLCARMIRSKSHENQQTRSNRMCEFSIILWCAKEWRRV